MIKIHADGYALPVQKALIDILEKELSQLKNITGDVIIINFKDPTYSQDAGGFHPVEIMLNAAGQIQYITDFAYVGNELVKELDFDFSAGVLEQMGMVYPIEQAWELFPIWQDNFCIYYSHQVFEVAITQC